MYQNDDDTYEAVLRQNLARNTTSGIISYDIESLNIRLEKARLIF